MRCIKQNIICAFVCLVRIALAFADTMCYTVKNYSMKKRSDLKVISFIKNFLTVVDGQLSEVRESLR